MAEEQVSTGATKGKGNDGGLLSKPVLEGIAKAEKFADELYNRLEFIRNGIKQGDNDCTYGAPLLLSDIMGQVYDEKERLEELGYDARALVEQAVDSSPFLPRFAHENDLIKAFKSIGEFGGVGESRFMTLCALYGQQVFRGLNCIPPQRRDVGEAIQQAWEKFGAEESVPSYKIPVPTPGDGEGEGGEVANG